MPVVAVEIGLTYLGSAIASTANTDDTAAVFLFNLFAGLENRRK